VSSREQILQRVRSNLPRVERPLPAVPLFDDTRPASLLTKFKESLERMGGLFLDVPPVSDPRIAVHTQLVGAKVVCSVVPEFTGNRRIEDVRIPQNLADVDLLIVRASFAVAETGSVLLSEAELGTNAVAYLAQHLIVLLDPDDIVINLHHAYQRSEFRERHYASLHTGPSATADIEGVLIHGAQGVRSLSVLPFPRASARPTI
jgi:L-lactate dehydrogenase complex protein LldG